MKHGIRYMNCHLHNNVKKIDESISRENFIETHEKLTFHFVSSYVNKNVVPKDLYRNEI